MANLLEIRNLHVGYGWDKRAVVPIVRNVSLTVGEGEVVGLAGESGCGKTTLAMAAAGLLDLPGRVTGGEIIYDGKDIAQMSAKQLRPLHLAEISTVFQASMNVLNPVMRVKDQFLDGMKAHGVKSQDTAMARAKEMFSKVKLPERFLDAYPHQLSGGMRQRAVIALALCLKPKLLFLDEPTTALDVVVQRSIMQMLAELREEIGFGTVFITHDLSLLVEFADRIAIMYAGVIVEEGTGQDLYENPEHPYTVALMKSFPPLGGGRQRMEGLGGSPPDMRRLPTGCPFHPRCPRFIEGVCETIDPPEVQTDPSHKVVCHLYSEKEARVG